VIEFLKATLDYLIMGLLGLMSFFMVWFVVERWLYFRRVDLNRFTHAQDLSVALTRHLTIVSSIGANAPYVGLLGTVLGILITFYDLGQHRGLDPGAVMLGLALALKATAMGLAVAIPSIVFYNALLRRVDVLTAEWQRQRR
jgi:biopolymer transport protein ExbB